MRVTKFIVTEDQLRKAIESGLKVNFRDNDIVGVFAMDIMSEVDALLYRKCERIEEPFVQSDRLEAARLLDANKLFNEEAWENEYDEEEDEYGNE